jgi:hypothetical protein
MESAAGAMSQPMKVLAVAAVSRSMDHERSSRSLGPQRWSTRWISGLVMVVVVASIAIAAIVVSDVHQDVPFTWESPTSAPITWHHVVTPAGTAVLSYPPSFRTVRSDSGSVSVAVGQGPRYVAYLNVTPHQGNERLQDFATFRVNFLRDDDATRVHEEGVAQNLRFQGGVGSGVLDDYFTRVGHNHYREIAALVTGRHGGWVIVGASLDADYGRFRQILQQAVSSFVVS